MAVVPSLNVVVECEEGEWTLDAPSLPAPLVGKSFEEVYYAYLLIVAASLNK